MKDDVFGGPIRWRMHLPVPPEEAYGALDADDGREQVAVEAGDTRA